MIYEKESKYMVDEKKFNEILGKKVMNCKYIKQNNYYYDDENFSLSKKSCTLRVRETQGDLQLQLKKQIGIDGMYRTSQENSADIIEIPSVIKVEEIQNFFDYKEDIFEKLTNNFFLLGNLQTTRHYYKLKNHILFLDKNIYLDKIDFEIEIEETGHDDEEYQLLKRELNLNELNFVGKKSRFLKRYIELNS